MLSAANINRFLFYSNSELLHLFITIQILITVLKRIALRKTFM